jgi:plastocyanin domain-containing protein
MRLRVYLPLFVVFLLVSAVHVMAQKNVYKAVVDKDGVQRVDMIGGGYFFNPDHIIVKVNIPVELKVKKEAGITPHDIFINEPEAGIVFGESLETKPKTIKFTPQKPGKYQFYCTKKLLFLKSHKDRGMEGIIEVIE